MARRTEGNASSMSWEHNSITQARNEGGADQEGNYEGGGQWLASGLFVLFCFWKSQNDVLIGA